MFPIQRAWEYMSGWNNPLPIGQSSGELDGGHGGTLTWMLGGHSSSRTDSGASSTYTTTDSRNSEPQCSLPLAFSSSSSLQLAFFVTHPPPLNLPLRPHCHLGIYRCQRSCATRAARLPHRLRQWKFRTRLIDGIYHLNGFGFLTSLYSSGFYSFILVIISMYLFGFEKLDENGEQSRTIHIQHSCGEVINRGR